ncbi:MAG TPA: branched-chain amino acid ABC transporter permease [Bellilinea sp.]|nr:branched-chain amino acid ABC transporter permease [Bellilinea sp.]
MKHLSSKTWKIVAFVGIFLVLLILPQVVRTGYIRNAMIDILRWGAFALAFNLIAGEVGQVSFGQSVFFGLGAYSTALIGSKLHLGWLGSMLFAAVAMGLLAIVVGFIFFRIREVTFAIGTMGFAIITQMWANTSMDVTGGSLCSLGVERAVLTLPFTSLAIPITKPVQFYYLLLPIFFIILWVMWRINNSRTGKAFNAVRDDEVRAASIGINPLKYKILGLVISAMVIGLLGSFQAQYLTVVCPSELGLEITNTLMIMTFVGGIGSLRGTLIGAAIFAALPRLLEAGGKYAVPPYLQQIFYGLILILVILFMPNGIDGLLRKRKKPAAPPTQLKSEELS